MDNPRNEPVSSEEEDEEEEGKEPDNVVPKKRRKLYLRDESKKVPRSTEYYRKQKQRAQLEVCD